MVFLPLSAARLWLKKLDTLCSQAQTRSGLTKLLT